MEIKICSSVPKPDIDLRELAYQKSRGKDVRFYQNSRDMKVDLSKISGPDVLYVVLKRTLHQNYYLTWDKRDRDRQPTLSRTMLKAISDSENNSVLGKRNADSDLRMKSSD